MKFLLQLTLLIILSNFHISAQTYGNEWIDYNQTYFKIAVYKKGIYKITKQMLDQSGFPTTTINPKNIQLFYRGEEQPIYIKGEDDFIFDANDYILFYGVPNDGWLDSAMFEHPEEQTNPYYSLINDTATYFLTWKTDTSVKKRFLIDNDTSFSAFSSATYCTTEQINNYTGSYYFGSDLANYASGEGWFDSQTFSNATSTKTIDLNGLYNNNGTVNFEICVVGVPNSDVVSGVWHELLIDINSINYVDTIFNGYEIIRENINIPANQLAIPVSVNLTSAFNGSVADRQTLAYIKVTYPHNFDIYGQQVFSFTINNATVQNKNKLIFSNFGGGNQSWLFDLTNAIMVPVNSGQALLPNGVEPHYCYLTSDDAIEEVQSLSKVTFTDFSVTEKNSDYIIITNKKIWQGATDYSNYREASGYSVLLVDVDELYDQFAYGIKKHSLSIRNFINYIINQYDSIPKAMFLLGKSIHTYLMRHDATYYEQCLVPTYGDPASDNLFTAGLNGTYYDLAIPIGRLSATTNDEVEVYLQKVIAYENNVPDAWMKYILHFGGGSDAAQQAQFAGFLSDYEHIIEDTLFGGFVSTFLKNSSQPMQITETDSIANLINNGISLMTFFGHGSTSGFDQNIDLPDAFNNYNKYPFILTGSCFAGDIHLPLPKHLSEDWILIQNKGAIGFWATASQGYINPLNTILTEIYKQITYKNYHKTIGKQIQETFTSVTDIHDLYLLKTVWDYTLHGDPAIVINSFTKPDLTINSADITLIPDYVSSLIDSFDVRVIVTNIGMTTTDTFVVELQRTYSDGNTDIAQKILAGCNFKDTILVRLPVSTINGTGINSLCVVVDIMNQIDELNENNNDACIDFYVHSTDIYPVYPYEYAIYPNDTVTLKASSGDPFMQEEDIIFQLDTSDSYSPPLFETTITTTGGVISWHLPLTMTDSMVYYWRVGKLGTNHYNESSFIYIPDKTGWSQAHFFQFKNNDFQFIDYNRFGRSFDFISTPKLLHAHNIGSVGSADFLNVKYDIDGNGDYSCCGANDAIILAVFDSLTLEPWTSDMQDFGHRDYPKCYSRSRPDYYFVFSTDSQSLENMASFINAVPDSNYLLAMSWRNGHFQSWPENAYLSFENLGASNIRFIQDNIPYIFFAQKGNVTSAHWQEGTNATDIVDLYQYLPTNFYYGNINSVKIGPSIHWNSFHWREHSEENPTNDSVFVEIKGLDLSGNETILMPHISIDSLDIYNLSDSIDALQYPYLKLRFFTFDDSTRSASQIDRWQLIYDEVPETAINPKKGFYLSEDTVSEGNLIYFAVATENISPYDMDSLLVAYWLLDASNSIHLLELKRLPPHPSGSILIDTIAVNTLNFKGRNRLRVEYNPVNPFTGTYDQLEQYHFNNIAEIHFTVEKDITNPILDVSFDGRHILDGEIVSAKPIISIKLKDENKYLLLNDTSLFAVYLTSLSDMMEERIYFRDSLGNKIMDFFPATTPENSCEIIFQPHLSNGMYALRVQAKDISDNESGDNDYYITFKVVTSPSITNVYTYPNPFSTGTHFVFNLTGTEVPQQFYIRIFSATGKLVKTINLNKVENIHIGPNYTDYMWDGTNDQGGKVNPGLYIYQITVKLNGENLPHAQHPMDGYLQRAYGKIIYIK
ncbi:MAG TPA: hypothetical protein EYP69_03145 [Bacteroidales bacterium]|nr:hypothetical protein [Bacteroidales bacterium]